MPFEIVPFKKSEGQHDYQPDFLVRLKGDPALALILEVKGYDPLRDVKAAAAQRWVKAVSADGRFGPWTYAVASDPAEFAGILDRATSP